MVALSKPGRRLAPINFLVVYARLGQKEQALRVLERAYNRGRPERVLLYKASASTLENTLE